MKFLLATLLAAVVATLGTAQLYDADFSNEGDGIPDHSTSNPPAPGPFAVMGGTPPNSWTAGYSSTPSTDNSDNEFSVNGGVLRIQDFGGTGTFASASIDVSALNFVDITATGIFIGSDVQNAAGEFFEYYYSLDGGAPVTTQVVGGNQGDPANYNVTNLDVSAASTLVVGFTFDVNGAGDGYEIASYTVTNAGTLPVTLTSFSARKAGQEAILEWAVAQEINNDYFEVEVSRSSADFAGVERIQGAGTSNVESVYHYAFTSSGSGTYYFRLKQVDFDGSATYSDVVQVSFGGRGGMHVLGNTVKDRLQLELESPADLVIVNMAGTVVMKQHIATPGRTSIDVSQLANGIYLISNGQTTRRFVK